MQAFGIYELDIQTVLSRHSSRVVNNGGKSFEAMSEELFHSIDDDAVEQAALKASVDIEEQTTAAHEEIERQLVALGVLEAPREQHAAVLVSTSSRRACL